MRNKSDINLFCFIGGLSLSDGRCLAKEATVAKLMGLRLLGLRNPNNIAVACIYLLNDGSEVIFIVKATQQHIQRALPGFVFGCQICSTVIT